MQIEPLHVVFPNTTLIASAETFFSVIREQYLDYRKRGMFVEQPGQAMYVYQLIEHHESFLGLICGIPAEEDRAGKVRVHEGTLAANEQQQLQLLLLREAVVKPVLLTYPTSNDIDSLLQRATKECPLALDVEDTPALRHRLYRVDSDSAIGAELTEAFATQVAQCYIADGHHRTRVLELYNESRERAGKPTVPLFAALFSSAQVQVRAYHRVVQLGVATSPLTLLARLAALFDIEVLDAPRVPTAPQQITLLLDDQSFGLTWRPNVLPSHGILLDAGLFNTLVAGPVLGVTDVRTDDRIAYVPGVGELRSVLDLVARRPDRAGFLLYGIEPRDMFAVVDAGLVMPPKSTWFEPRMRNGLIVQEVS